MSEENQRLFYIRCNLCRSKTTADKSGLQYFCQACKQTVTTTVRALVIMSIGDGTVSLKVIAVDDVAEQILQSTVEHVFRLMNVGATYELDNVRASLNGKTFQMLVRRNYTRQNDSQRKPLLIGYFEDNSTSKEIEEIKGIYIPASFEKKGAAEPLDLRLSPLKRQITEIYLASKSSVKSKLFKSNDATGDDERTS